MTTILKCGYHPDWTRGVTEGQSASREYQKIWKVVLSPDTPDDIDGTAVLAAARALTPGAGLIKIDQINDLYTYGAYSDTSSRAQTIKCEREDGESVIVWKATADYKPNEGDLKLKSVGPGAPSHPLLWPSIGWLEHIEEQAVVEKAICFSTLEALGRSLIANAYGFIGNATGQQTIDPTMELDHRVILNILIHYPTDLYAVALNNQFHKTVHAHSNYVANPSGDPDAGDDPIDELGESMPFMLGCPFWTWKFLHASSEKAQWRAGKKGGEDAIIDGDDVEEREGQIKYFPTTVKFEFKLGDLVSNEDLGIEDPHLFRQGWIRKVLNNGQVCFRKWQSKISLAVTEKYILDPRTAVALVDRKPLLLPTTARQLKDDFNVEFEDPRPPSGIERPQPEITDFDKDLPTSEPVNLKLNGTQITNPTDPATYIYYLNLKPANYFYITDYFGNPVFSEDIELPVFPLESPLLP